MSKRVAYVPKHRTLPEASLTAAPRKALRTTVVLSAVAVAATGLAVSGGVLSAPAAVSTAAAGLGAGPGTTSVKPLSDDRLDQKLAQRAADTTTSRSADRRDAKDPTKKAALKQSDGPAITRSVDLSQQDPRDIARALLPEFGFSADQFGCLDSLYSGESGWRVNADNPTSSAYGIPQALPGSKMSSAGADWATNAVTQIRWGLGYIADSYGSPCGAQAFKSGHGFY